MTHPTEEQLDALEKRLREVGKTTGVSWASYDPHTYFDHSGGKVSLRQASAFFSEAKTAGREAADTIASLRARLTEAEVAIAKLTADRDGALSRERDLRELLTKLWDEFDEMHAWTQETVDAWGSARIDAKLENNCNGESRFVP